MNATAARARDLALKKHRREVMFWKGILLPVLAVGLSVGVAVGMLIQEAIEGEPQVWRTDAAPVGEPYWVTTMAYVRKHDKQWCSFTNGEPIEISHWTTAQP
jgi:hypothetical protein